MEISQIISSGAAVTIAVTAAQLQNFANDLIKKARAEREAELLQEGNEVYYTQEQVTKLLNVTRQTLWYWDTKSDYLHPVTVGGGLKRYKKSDIDRILNR